MPQVTERTRIRIHPERAVPEGAADVLASGMVAHVGIVDEVPLVIPMTYHYDPAEPDRIHLHGALHSRLMKHLASGATVCVAVTELNGLIYSRTALNHSVNYRSVVCLARATEPPGAEERRRLLQAMIARYFPGRAAGRDYAETPDVHVAATAFVTLEVVEWNAKQRVGGAKGPHDADPAAPGSAGVVELPRGELPAGGPGAPWARGA